MNKLFGWLLIVFFVGCSDSVVDNDNNKSYSLFEIAAVRAQNLQEGALFGASLAMSDDYIAIGSPGKDVLTYKGAGGVYLFKKDMQDEVHFLKSIDSDTPASDSSFGDHIAMFGSFILVGASEYSSNTLDSCGKAYLYKILEDGNVTKVGDILPSDLQAYDSFAKSVAISSRYIAIGTDADKVYLYEYNATNITFKEKLEGDDSQYSSYGSEVVMVNDLLTVSAPSDSTDRIGSRDSGKVYVYHLTNSNITRIAKLAGGADERLYGYKIGMDASHIVILNANPVYYDIYTITKEQRIEKTARMLPNDPLAKEICRVLHVSEDHFFVGTLSENVYVFSINGENNISQIQSLSGEFYKATNSYFGASLAVSDDTILIGAPSYSDARVSNSGAAYMFSANPFNKIYVYTKPKLDFNISEEDPLNRVVFDAKSPNGTINYSVEAGEDGGFFQYVGKSLTLKQPLNYEVPQDLDSDNIYKLKVKLSDGGGNTQEYNISVGVEDRNYTEYYHKEQGVTNIVMNDKYVFVGDSSYNSYEGRLVVYKRDTNNSLTQLSELVPEGESSLGTYYGDNFSVSQDYILMSSALVSNFGDQDIFRAGAAYLYKITDDNITQLATITSANPQVNDMLGISNAMEGDYIVLASQDANNTLFLYKRISDDNITLISQHTLGGLGEYAQEMEMENSNIVLRTSKSVYMFRVDGNETLQELATLQQHSANSIDIQNNTIAVGNDTNVTIFKLDANNTASLLTSFWVPDTYVKNVSLDGNSVAVGAPYRTTEFTEDGEVSVYAFDASGNVTQLDTLHAYNPMRAGGFGISVSKYNDNIAVGAQGNSMMYLFKKDTD